MNNVKSKLRIPSHHRYNLSDENFAVELLTYTFTCQKMAYIHENPVRIGWVKKAKDWLYSSQRNYSRYLIDVLPCIQIKNLAPLRRRRSLRIAWEYKGTTTDAHSVDHDKPEIIKRNIDNGTIPTIKKE